MALLRSRNDKEQGTRVADWVITKGRFINRSRYRGVLSKQKSFFCPREYVLYLRSEKNQYFNVAFEPDEISSIEKIYSYLDMDMTGQLCVDEFCRFMAALSVTYASRNNNRSEGAPQMSRAVSAASSRNLLDGPTSAEDLLETSFVNIFKLLDKGGKGYLKYEDFVLFFVSLPCREVDVRKSYLLRSSSLSSIAHVSTRSIPMSEKGGTSAKFSSKINAVAAMDSNSVYSFHDNKGLYEGDNDSVSALSLSSAGRAKLSKGGSVSAISDIDMEEDTALDNSLQGNEFRIVDVVTDVPELALFKANVDDLSMIFDELLVSNKEQTVWDTNKLHAADILITKSPPWFKKAFKEFKKTVSNMISRIKALFKKKPEEEATNDENEEEISDDEVQDFDYTEDDVSPPQTKNKKKNRQNEVTAHENLSNMPNSLDDDEEEGFSFFSGNKRDTTATHGPVCFCGCGNPYWNEEEGTG